MTEPHDPLETLILDHRAQSEWLDLLWQVSVVLGPDPGGDFPRVKVVDDFYRQRLAPHMRLEEEGIFPVLRSAEPDPALHAFLDRLAGQHRVLRTDAEALLDLLRAAPDPERIQARARLFVDRLLRHAEDEDATLLPLVAKHRQALEAALRAWDPEQP